MRRTLLLIALLLTSPVGRASETADVDEFLRRLGFEDYSRRQLEEADAAEAIDPERARRLRLTASRYAVFTASRNLAVKTIRRLRSSDHAAGPAAAALAGRLLAHPRSGDVPRGEWADPMDDTPFAGRALVAALVREANLLAAAGAFEAEERVREALVTMVRNAGYSVEEVLAPTTREPLRTGDLLFRRGVSPASGAIAWGVRPAPRDALRALRLGLWAPPFGAVFPDPDDDADAYEALPAPLRGAARALAKSPPATMGMSHVGIAWVPVADGIPMAWSLDVTTSDEGGGIRIAGISETFAPPSRYERFVAARIEPEGLAKSFLRRLSREGFRDTVWTSEDGTWEADLPPAGLQRLHFPMIDSPRAWARAMHERAVRHIIDVMLSREALAFSAGVRDRKGSVYCSQLVLLAYLRANGIDLQERPDVWNPVIQMGSRLGLAEGVARAGGRALGMDSEQLAALNLDHRRRIIAPGGLLWQKHVRVVDWIEYR